MNVIPTSSLTPHYLFVLGVEFHEADRTVAVDIFSLAPTIFRRSTHGWACWGFCENLLEFLVDPVSTLCRTGNFLELTDEMKASWYWRWEGALRTLYRTFAPF